MYYKEFEKSIKIQLMIFYNCDIILQDKCWPFNNWVTEDYHSQKFLKKNYDDR